MTRATSRDAILDAALRLSGRRGFDAVSTADVCEASGATNGSFFHFFPTKEHLHAALYVRALARYQEAIATGLERSRSARSGVRGLVLGHARWVVDHPDEARVLHEGRRAGTSRALADEIGTRNRELFGRISAWLRPHVAAGAIGKLPGDVLVAIVFGPVHLMTRERMRGADRRRLVEAAPHLADAAWAALSAGAKEKRNGRTSAR